MTGTDPADVQAAHNNGRSATAFPRTPRWLRVVGLNCWLALGVAGLAALILWALSYTHQLVTPFLIAAVLAVLFTPVFDWLTQHRMPRLLAAALVLLGLVIVAVVATLAIVRGIAQVAPQIGEVLDDAAAEVEAWLGSAGVSPSTASDVTSSALAAGQTVTFTLVNGVVTGLGALSSVLFMLFVGSVIFLFMGGFFIAVAMRRWNLHRRVALGVVAATGTSPPRPATWRAATIRASAAWACTRSTWPAATSGTCPTTRASTATRPSRP